MLDGLFVGLTVVFFAIGVGYVVGCGALNRGVKR